MHNVKVYILTEGGANIGFGHITRCLSIYQMFEQRGISPNFIINADESVKDLIRNTSYKLFDWINKTERLFTEIKNADVVVIDSYLAPEKLYHKISDNVKLGVYLDDNMRVDYPPGIVVNGAIYAPKLDYPNKGEITYLLGSKYQPIRNAFWNLPERKIKKTIKTVMITFGGDDMRELTPQVLKLLNDKHPDLIKRVIVGKGFSKNCVDNIKKCADNNTELIYNANAEQMKNTMLESDIAISAAGQTLFELAVTRTPSIAIQVVDNQENNVRGFLDAGGIFYAGNWQDNGLMAKVHKGIDKLKSKEEREKISGLGKKLMGKNNLRLVDCILDEITF